MTALWENTLDSMSRKETQYQAFMQPLVSKLNELIVQAGSVLPTALQGVKSPTPFKKNPMRVKVLKQHQRQKKR